MIENIEAKISEHINTILSKDVITHDDYRILTNELCRLKQKEHEAKFEEESKERTEKMQALFSEIIKTPMVP